MNSRDFLLEIGVEELPAHQVTALVESLAKNVQQELVANKLKHGAVKAYATPRRLAIFVEQLVDRQPDNIDTVKGPALSVAFDAQGNPTVAAEKFAQSCGVSVAQLERCETPKGQWLVCDVKRIGATIQQLLPAMIGKVIKSLVLSRSMRWLDQDISFIRPVRWAVLLYGTEVIQTEILGVVTSNVTYGHRFHCPGPININQPANYAELLLTRGYVVPDLQQRCELIRAQMALIIAELGCDVAATIDEKLLQEVVCLVEWPVVLVGKFAEHFLQLPAEVLLSTLKQKQRCFPLVNKDGQLLASFIMVSNIASKDPQKVIVGNERVVRARLSDAEFFYKNDIQHSLDSYLPKLQATVFHAGLGSLYAKTERLVKLSAVIAEQIGIDSKDVQRAAQLSKCDLLTSMVGEFPELQGIMGYHYALQQQEIAGVAIALKEQYLPRFAHDALPSTTVGCVLAIADRLDTLCGCFLINKIPTGEKDPFGLRRAAIGIIRIILEQKLLLDLRELLQCAIGNYEMDAANVGAVQNTEKTLNFILERLRAWYLDKGVAANLLTAVMACDTGPLSNIVDFDRRVQAVTYFQTLPEAEALSMANKRVVNILHKNNCVAVNLTLNERLLLEPAEQLLASQLVDLTPKFMSLYAAGDYEAALSLLAQLKSAVDGFFDTVTVMVDDIELRNNRLALLQQLKQLFSCIADIALL